MNVLRIYSDKILSKSDKKLFKECDLTLTRTAEGVIRVTRVPDDCRKITLKVVEFVFGDCMVAWNTDAPVRLADALKKRVRKSNVTRHKKAAATAPAKPLYTARDASGETIEVAAPSPVRETSGPAYIGVVNVVEARTRVELYEDAYKLGAHRPSAALFREAAAREENEFRAEALRINARLAAKYFG